MADIPQTVIDAILAAYPRMPEPVARNLLQIIEEAWPHLAPGRDQRSTVNATTERATPPRGRRFGFHPPDVHA